MQLDFHYYATYCAACIAGYTPEESLQIAYSAQFVDCCSVTLLSKTGGPLSAATTQLQLEMMNEGSDISSIQNMTRIWASFHFLPGDLHAEKEKCGRRYLSKYRLICNPNSSLLAETVELVRGRGLPAAGLAMHILADTWAHRYFAGTPSLAINNTTKYFYEIVPEGESFKLRPIRFNHNPSSPDVPEKGVYTNSLFQSEENSVMNLGHGRAGHLPDYSYARYIYMPAWGEYKEIIKDNPSDYLHAFCQMVYALKCLKEGKPFETERYDAEAIWPYKDDIIHILTTRQTDACSDWKALAERISGCSVEDFDIEKYQKEYMNADESSRDETFLGQFFIAAMAQKSMVTNRIFISGSLIAGFSIDFREKGFAGIKDFQKLAEQSTRSTIND